MNNYDYIIQAFTRDGNNTNLEVNNLDVGCITSLNNNFELDSNGNLTVNSITANSIIGNAIASAIYPVGSIYMSVSSTNPSILFGGTWEQLKDRFLLGCGDTYQNATTGGEAIHALTINELPAHTHNMSSLLSGWVNDTANVQWNYSGQGYRVTDNPSQGGNAAHNNMPPYLTVYMWKRIS